MEKRNSGKYLLSLNCSRDKNILNSCNSCSWSLDKQNFGQSLTLADKREAFLITGLWGQKRNKIKVTFRDTRSNKPGTKIKLYAEKTIF